MYSMINIEGKTALITGSSRGIGQQIAQGLAEKECPIMWTFGITVGKSGPSLSR